MHDQVPDLPCRRYRVGQSSSIPREGVPFIYIHFILFIYVSYFGRDFKGCVQDVIVGKTTSCDVPCAYIVYVRPLNQTSLTSFA